MSDFQSRLLYTQKSSAVLNEEEPVTVSSTIYAIRYMYPGATQHTTNRIRITCTYRDAGQFESHAGVIERWSDKGWLIMDDYTDSILNFTCEEDFRKRLLDYTQSFVLGIPLSAIDKNYIYDMPSMTSKSSKTKFKFEAKDSAVDKKTKKKTETQKDNYSKESSKKDDDDIDWL